MLQNRCMRTSQRKKRRFRYCLKKMDGVWLSMQDEQHKR